MWYWLRYKEDNETEQNPETDPCLREFGIGDICCFYLGEKGSMICKIVLEQLTIHMEKNSQIPTSHHIKYMGNGF
jgi:hypothetical protein